MINVTSFPILHSGASLVAGSLAELCIKRVKRGKRTCCVKPPAKDIDVVAKIEPREWW